MLIVLGALLHQAFAVPAAPGYTQAPTDMPTTQAPTDMPTASSGIITVPSGLCVGAQTLPSVPRSSLFTYSKALNSFGGGTLTFQGEGFEAAVRNGIVYDITNCNQPVPSISSIPAASTFAVHCSGSAECDAYVFFYHDPPASSFTNGGLPAVLIDDGWTATSCAPSFHFPLSGSASTDSCKYKMTGFRKILKDGQSESFTTHHALETKFFTITMVPKMDCGLSTITNEWQCNATHWETDKTSTCKWDSISTESGECKDSFCQRSRQAELPKLPRPPSNCPAANLVASLGS